MQGCVCGSTADSALPKASLLVCYRPLAHLRFREETERVAGETTPLVLLRVARRADSDLLGLASPKLDKIAGIGRISGDPSRRLRVSGVAFGRRDRSEPSRARRVPRTVKYNQRGGAAAALLRGAGAVSLDPFFPGGSH